MVYEVIILAFIIHMSKCSVVLDSLSQRGIHVSDYCPKMKFCPEGAHVMCMYYDRKHVMSPRCSNPKNVSITHELANKLLEVSNAVRSKIALGKEKGKGGNYLPRGYGIFRLKWDSELATFAQVLANQCVLRHDMCRATKILFKNIPSPSSEEGILVFYCLNRQANRPPDEKFPDPGQTAGLVRFSYPDWYPVSKSAHFTTPGLNTPKLFYAITQTLKSWYGQKNSVTSDMITSYPDWNINPNNQDGRLYLEMIYGPATHMGCGISAYTEYAYYDNNAALNYNSVQIICNYSSRPRKFGPVYNTIPPTTQGLTTKCGCPEGSEEDNDCLCQENSKIPDSIPLKHVTRKCTKGDINCDPTVVVLPIFTMEDAPQHKLITSYGSGNESIMDNNSLDIFDNYEKSEPKHDLIKEQINAINDRRHVDFENMASITRPASVKKKPLDVRNRYFHRKAVSASTRNLIESRKTLLKHTPPQRRHSVFTRVPRFELPLTNTKQTDNVNTFSGIKKDVAPRKNFDSAQNLVKRYMSRKITNDPFNKINIPEPKKSLISDNDIHGIHGVTETLLHTAEDKVIDYNRYLNDNTNAMVQPITQGLNKATDKLMTLLDNLEKLVKTVELGGTDKVILDAKIRKIYEQVIDKPINLLNSDKKMSEFQKSLSDSETHKSNYHDTRTNALDNYSKPDFSKRPLSRNQNSLIKDEEMQKEFNDNVKDSRAKFINSDESPQYSTYPEEIKPRNIYKSVAEKSVYRNENDEKFKHITNKERMTKNYEGSYTYDDPLSPDRRKYYQNKLERLERKLINTRKHRNALERQRGVRPMRPTEDLHTPTRSKTQMEDTFYPERARFLNKF